jgi:hypothetical protein
MRLIAAPPKNGKGKSLLGDGLAAFVTEAKFASEVEKAEMLIAEDELIRQCRSPDGAAQRNKCAAARIHFPAWFSR